MTWLLARLGLSLTDSKTLLPIAAFIAACVAAVGLAVYVAHALTREGYRTAAAECEARNQSALAGKREAETQLKEANRDVIIRHVADKATLTAAAPWRQKELEIYATAHPAIASCDLPADGLRLWNADPLGGSDAPLRIRPAVVGAKPGQPASGDGRDATSADGKSR